MIPQFRLKAQFISFLAVIFLAAPPVKATVLDDFEDGDESTWQDFSFGVGTSTEANGVLTFSIPDTLHTPIFAATTKKNVTYTLQDKRTIEFRVDLLSGNSKDAFGILSFIPDSQSIQQLAGYSLVKSPTDILIAKGSGKYFYVGGAMKNDNVTMVLRLTGAGTSVIINAQILDKDANNAVIFDQTVVDTAGVDVLVAGSDSPQAPFMGPGKYTLLEYQDYAAGNPTPYEVVFDNAVAYVTDSEQIDDFNDGLEPNWQDFSFGVGTSTEANGVLTFAIPDALHTPIFAATTYTPRTYELQDGEKLEFRVDMVTGNSKDSFGILSWLPTSQSIDTLNGYSIVKSSTDVLMAKGSGKYMYVGGGLKNDNITLVLALERRGANMIINGKILDKDANNAVIFDQTFIDTPGVDVLVAGSDSPQAPYTGPGHYVLMEYEDYATGGPASYEVIFDNAVAAGPPVAALTPPSITDVLPDNYSNFVPATSAISFKVLDEKPIPGAGISVTLNGTKYTSANGLTLTANGNTTTASLGGLSADKDYTALIEVTDSDNLKANTTIHFDTFAQNSFTVEAEDYNFGSGLFIDNPILVADGDFQPNGYRSERGEPDVDYHSTNGGGLNGPYRPEDHVAMRATLDYARKPYVDAGGTAAGFVDYDVTRIRTGEWQNYTRTFPAGTFLVYLRQSYLNVPNGEVILEKVNGSPSDPAAPVETLGSFLGANTGTKFANVPLTDATGTTPVVVALDGVTTLRLRQNTSEPGDGDIFQNYLVFIPTAPVVNRPTAVSLTPAARSTVTAATLTVGATLQDRDTTVNVSSVELFINGAKVNPTVTSAGNGQTTISYPVTPLPATGSTIDASLRFADSANVRITNNWSFTMQYKSMNSANRVSSVANRGFNVRVVQAPAGSDLANSVQRAEDQLLLPTSPIEKAYDLTTTSDVVNFSQTADSSDGHFPNDILIPGLDSAEAQGTDDIAMEITAYMELPAGPIRFGVTSDDGFKLSAGSGLHDLTPVLDFRSGGTADQTVDVFVPAAGFYPVRLLWYERGGGAHVEFFTVDMADPTKRTLINDPNTSEAIKAYRDLGAAPTIAVYSSATVDGTFTADAAATVDTNAKTITIPLGTGNRFYRLSGNVALNNSRLAGANLVFNYQ